MHVSNAILSSLQGCQYHIDEIQAFLLGKFFVMDRAEILLSLPGLESGADL